MIVMINHTEERLAKKAEIAFSLFSKFSVCDCWHQTFHDGSQEMVLDNTVRKMK